MPKRVSYAAGARRGRAQRPDAKHLELNHPPPGPPRVRARACGGEGVHASVDHFGQPGSEQ
jgi:hypothetical protein